MRSATTKEVRCPSPPCAAADGRAAELEEVTDRVAAMRAAVVGAALWGLRAAPCCSPGEERAGG